MKRYKGHFPKKKKRKKKKGKKSAISGMSLWDWTVCHAVIYAINYVEDTNYAIGYVESANQLRNI